MLVGASGPKLSVDVTFGPLETESNRTDTARDAPGQASMKWQPPLAWGRSLTLTIGGEGRPVAMLAPATDRSARIRDRHGPRPRQPPVHRASVSRSPQRSSRR